MRNLIVTVFLIVSLFCIIKINPTAVANNNSQPVIMPKGTFLKGMSPVQISTSLLDIGDEVYFINPCDMYIGETNVVPLNSRFIGYVEDLREAVQGTNAAVKIRITKIATPNNKIVPIEAYVNGDDDHYLGGEMTHPAYYAKKPTYIKGWSPGVLQYVPTNIREMGRPTIINPGTEIYIVLVEDLEIK